MSITATVLADCITFPWEDRAGEAVRCLVGPSTVISGIDVHVEGIESASGIDRTIVLNDVDLTPGEARQLAARLIAAADEVTRQSNISSEVCEKTA